MRHSRFSPVLLCLLFVGVNTTARDQQHPSKFDKYQSTAQIRRIDWLVLQASLQAVRDWVDGRYESIETPVITFNPKLMRVEAFANVNSDELSELPIGELKLKLHFAAIQTGVSVQLFMQEFDSFRGTDFYMQFRGISLKAAKLAGGDKSTSLPMSTFAEFENGEIVLH
jgi:hypothetical protein